MTKGSATVYLGLGSNLGDRERHIHRALELLKGHVRIDSVSSLYETAPIGFREQPQFLNAVCRCRTTLSPSELLAFTKRLEAGAGRTPSFKNGPREIDIDILLFDDLVMETEGLTIPHPRMAERGFVLAPLAEIAPEVRHPVSGKTARELLDAAGSVGVRRLKKAAQKGDAWTELRVTVMQELVEPLVELFAKQGKAAVAVQEQGYSVEWTESPPASASATVYAYLPHGRAGVRRRARIEAGLALLGLIVDLPPLEEREVAEAEWEAVLRGHFSILHAGGRLVIRPEWLDYTPREGEVVVTLDPGIAFGTGHHPTTRLCLAVLEAQVRPGARVLDVGTGSGILAAAAGALGAGDVAATDTDPQAVRSARRAARMNGLQRRVRIQRGSLPQLDEPFDIVVMNITAKVIAALLPRIPERLTASGAVVISGVLEEQRTGVAEAAQSAGLAVVEEFRDGDWLAMVLRRA